jgi:predicted transcriptional regulator
MEAAQEPLEALTEAIPALKRLAAAVRKGRERKSWSQYNLAEFVGVSRDVIQRLEGGEHDVRCSVLFRVLPVLELDEQDLQRILYGQQGAKRIARKGDTTCRKASMNKTSRRS